MKILDNVSVFERRFETMPEAWSTTMAPCQLSTSSRLTQLYRSDRPRFRRKSERNVMSESKQSNNPTKTMSTPLEAPQEMKTDTKTSNVEQPTTTRPKWIPVEELGDYYASHRPIGRRYPVQSQLEFDDLYVEDSRDGIQDGESKNSDNKQAANPSKSSLAKSVRFQTEAKADSVVQSTSSKSTKGKGKRKISQGGYGELDEDEGSQKDEKKKEDQTEDLNAERYKSCDHCTWAKVKCVMKEGDKNCFECQKHGRNCHFSIKGQRPAVQPLAS